MNDSLDNHNDVADDVVGDFFDFEKAKLRINSGGKVLIFIWFI